MEPRKNIRVEKRRNTFQQIEKIHPYKMLLYLGMIGIAMIFLFLLVAFTFNLPKASLPTSVDLPKVFTLSTILLLISSYVVTKALRAFDEDRVQMLTKSLGITLLVGLAFATLQVFGWLELKSAGVFLDEKPASTFLYLITGIHTLHFLAGIVILMVLFIHSIRIYKDPVKQLILVTNPFEKLKLELFAGYWHFLGGLWLMLFFYFLFIL